MTDKAVYFAAIISDKMMELFEDEFNLEDIVANGEMTDLLYAYSSLAPFGLMKELSDQARDLLEFNHLMNRIIVQNMELSNKNLDES